MNVHKLKEVEPYFSDVASGKKRFEIRPASQDFQIGDMVMVCQFKEKQGYTGVDVQKTVSYILKDYPGLQEGYVVLGLEDYKHQAVDVDSVRMKVHREGFDFLSRDMFGDCPHCGQHILRSKSSDTCSECGKPIRWSENKYSSI